MRHKKILTMLLSAAMVFGVTATVASCANNGAGSNIVAGAKASATVKFNLNLDGYETNIVKDKQVKIGKRVPIAKAYITSDNPSNLQLYGWYTDAACTNAWDFKNDRVEGDMTLYAKWVEQYTVNYYVNGVLTQSSFAFKGDTLAEDASLVTGFKYLGTYLDENHENVFDYSVPVSGDLDLYIRRSEGIYLSDHADEGEVSSGSLSDYLVAYLGTTSMDSKGNIIEEEGWVEPYTVSTQYAGETVQEQCTYVNFGYSPNYGDGFVELCLALDITQSQVIRVWFKNLGTAKEVNMYFTALLDAEKNIYSETGAVYTQDYCYPNYTGSGVGDGIELAPNQIGMDETAEWTYVDFNLHEVHTNGYSIWGTSAYLGMLRFQVNYKNKSEEDWSNEFLIKAIEGIPEEIVVDDSNDVKALISNAINTTPDALNNASNEQAGNPQGLVFPKDFSAVNAIDDGVDIYNSVNGLIFYAENEVLSREKGNPYYGFTMVVPEGKSISLDDLTTFNITLRNYGYGENITARIYNNIGIPVNIDLKIAKRMSSSKTYTANLYGKYGMEGTLSKIEIRYTSVGVDNAMLIEGIEMTSFVPYDIVGLNFNDKYCFGIESTNEVEVSFDGNREGTLFNVSKNGASVTSANRSYKATTDGYAYATLQYYLYKDSNVSEVTVQYKINGAFTSGYTYTLDPSKKGANGSVTLPFKSNERGIVQAVRFTFKGTGKVLVKSIDYSINETSLPFYLSYEDIYTSWSEWKLGNLYQYDNSLKASILTKGPSNSELEMPLYIGITALRAEHMSVPHSTKNILVTETTKIKIVYQNRTETDTMGFVTSFARSDIGNPDSDGLAAFEAKDNKIDCLMKDYEWSTLTIEVPTSYVGKYIGKISIKFTGKEIAIRAISIETGV